MTEIKFIVVNGKKKAIEVKDGYVLVFCGHGPCDGAVWKKFEECSEVEFAAAKEVESLIDDETKDAIRRAQKDFYEFYDDVPTVTDEEVQKFENVIKQFNCFDNPFDNPVDFLTRCSGEDFLELVHYAKSHNNTFFHCVKELDDVVNADDCYCTALIKLARPLGKTVEKRAFELFEEATAENAEEEDFIEFWRALQTINNLC